MPLPKETLEKIKQDIDAMEASYTDLTELIADAVEAGYDVADRQAKLADLVIKINRAKTFYRLQLARTGE